MDGLTNEEKFDSKRFGTQTKRTGVEVTIKATIYDHSISLVEECAANKWTHEDGPNEFIVTYQDKTIGISIDQLKKFVEVTATQGATKVAS